MIWLIADIIMIDSYTNKNEEITEAQLYDGLT
jgi:hypothetical protein